MILDSLINAIFLYGIYALLVVVLLKFIVLLSYKPSRPSYAFKNLLAYFFSYKYYAVKDKDIANWQKMKRINNPLAIALYCIFAAWVLSAAVVIIFSHK